MKLFVLDFREGGLSLCAVCPIVILKCSIMFVCVNLCIGVACM